MENHFSLKGKTTKQTSNNFTIIKSITIILIYVSRLKKKSLIFLCSHTHKLSFSKGNNPSSFLFHYVAPPSFSLCGTYLLNFIKHILYIYIYIEFCRLTSFPRIIWIPNSTLIIILEEHYYFHNSN